MPKITKEIRVVKSKNFTVIDNAFLRRKDMSLKAKGLLTFMLSLPADWDYSVTGLSRVLKEGLDGVRSAINELERSGYMVRSENSWIVYEVAALENPTLENPTLENPTLENPTQINKDFNKIKIFKQNKDFKKRGFRAPTLEEVEEYCLHRQNDVDPITFVNFYQAKDWYIGKNRMKDWQAAVRTWERNRETKQPTRPSKTEEILNMEF